MHRAFNIPQNWEHALERSCSQFCGMLKAQCILNLCLLAYSELCYETIGKESLKHNFDKSVLICSRLSFNMTMLTCTKV